MGLQRARDSVHQSSSSLWWLSQTLWLIILNCSTTFTTNVIILLILMSSCKPELQANMRVTPKSPKEHDHVSFVLKFLISWMLILSYDVMMHKKHFHTLHFSLDLSLDLECGDTS